MLQKQVSMQDPLTLGKLFCHRKAGDDTGFESAGEWGGCGEFGFLQGWENVFFGFIPLGRIKPCDLFWKGAGIKPKISEI